jgi:hypothetical protein
LKGKIQLFVIDELKTKIDIFYMNEKVQFSKADLILHCCWFNWNKIVLKAKQCFERTEKKYFLLWNKKKEFKF